MSSTTATGASARAASSPAAPSCRTSTPKPSRVRYSLIRSQMCGSSSTTSTSPDVPTRPVCGRRPRVDARGAPGAATLTVLEHRGHRALTGRWEGASMASSRADLAFLYRRAAFGARPEQLDAAVTAGYEAAVEGLLGAGAAGGGDEEPPPAFPPAPRLADLDDS